MYSTHSRRRVTKCEIKICFNLRLNNLYVFDTCSDFLEPLIYLETMKEHPATKLNYDKSAIQVKYADKWKESGQIDVLMDGQFAGSPHLCFQNCSPSINDVKDHGNVKSDGSFNFRKHANLFYQK